MWLSTSMFGNSVFQALFSFVFFRSFDRKKPTVLVFRFFGLRPTKIAKFLLNFKETIHH